MKIHYLIAALALCMPAAVQAQVPDMGTVVSPEYSGEVRDTVNALAQLVSGQQQKVAAPVSQPQEHKTPADVADKALTLFSGAIAQVAASIQKVAPEVFRIMVQQQYVKAASNLVAPGGAIVIMLLIAGWLRRLWKDPADHECDEYVARIILAHILPTVLVASFGIWFVSNLSESVGYLFNPKFYAIKDLVTLALHPMPTP